MELNTLDAFRGVVRQGEIIALLPQGALLDCRHDSTLAVRSIAKPALGTSNLGTGDLEANLTRQVVMVTTSDRMSIPPIAHFYQLVQKMSQFPELQSILDVGRGLPLNRRA